jgi:hypothetical protein
VHNANVLLGGRPAEFRNELFYFESHGALLNAEWGTNPLAAVSYFEGKGYGTRASMERKEFAQILAASDVSLVTYKNRGDLSFHTVAVTGREPGKGIFVFNDSNVPDTNALTLDEINGQYKEYGSLAEMLDKNSDFPICIVGIQK